MENTQSPEGAPADELTAATYAANLEVAYRIAGLLKGMPLATMARMVNMAKLGAPLATTAELRETKARFDRDAVLVERLNAVREAFAVLLPDVRVCRPMLFPPSPPSVVERVGHA